MNHKELDVWKESIKLVEIVYSITKELPDDEKFGLISQMRRAAVSVPSNIAEGAARKSKKEFIRFCYIALGSLSELETQVILMERLFELSIQELTNQLQSCRKLLSGFIRHLTLKATAINKKAKDAATKTGN